MKINFNPINYNPISYNKPVNFNGIFSFRKKPVTDTFEKRTKKEESYPKKPFSYEEDLKGYKKISKKINSEEQIRGTSKAHKAAENSYRMAKIIKRGLDKEIGPKKYTIVSIGTSPAGVARALDYMGEDVKYVPISGLRGFKYSDSDVIETLANKEHKEYKRYLDSIGINAETINKSDKKHIFYDYTMSGSTLSAVKHIATNALKIDPNKMEFRSLNDDLMKFANTKSKKRGCGDYIDKYLALSQIYGYVGIPHISYFNTDTIKEKVKEENSPESKDFNYALCYFIDQDGLLR